MRACVLLMKGVNSRWDFRNVKYAFCVCIDTRAMAAFAPYFWVNFTCIHCVKRNFKQFVVHITSKHLDLDDQYFFFPTYNVNLFNWMKTFLFDGTTLVSYYIASRSLERVFCITFCWRFQLWRWLVFSRVFERVFMNSTYLPYDNVFITNITITLE